MDENKAPPLGKGVISGGKKPSLLVCAVLLAVLALSYAGLCFYVALSGRILPNVSVGRLDVGGRTEPAASAQIDSAFRIALAQVSVPLTYGENGQAEIPGTCFTPDADAAARAAFQVGREGFPAGYGFRLLKALFVPAQSNVYLSLGDGGPDLSALLDDLFAGQESPVTQTCWTQEKATLRLTRGIPGLAYDRAQTKALLLASASNYLADHLRETPLPIHVDPVATQPDPVDWQELAAQVRVDPVDAFIDPKTQKVIPSSPGLALDVKGAKALFDAAPAGGEVEIPLTVVEPEVTTADLGGEEFPDLLGEATTQVNGSANRKKNVIRAAELVNGAILQPGDVFAYNETTGRRTAENGFFPAPAYVNGLTVNEYGGGVCQVSSTLYSATLLANLKIVERRNHSYVPGYLPNGLDATVSFGTQDYKFQNDRENAIKVVAFTVEKDDTLFLTTQIYGVNRDGSYVKMETEHLGSYAYSTVYKADASVPAGTTRVSVTPYTGAKTDSYRCVYAADGTLLSRTKEATSTYKKRDKVILYNPADAALYDPNYVAPTPAPEATPVPTPAPVPTAPPVSPEFALPSYNPNAVPSETLPTA